MRGIFLTYIAVWLVSMSAFYLTITGCSQQPDEAASLPAAIKPPPPRPVQVQPIPVTPPVPREPVFTPPRVDPDHPITAPAFPLSRARLEQAGKAASPDLIEPRGSDRISAAAKAGTASGGDLDRLAAPPHRPRAGRAVADEG